MTDAEKLTGLIRHAMEDLEHTEPRAENLSPEYQELGDTICECLSQMREVSEFTASIADGELSCPVPPRSNYMAGASKDLYYKLRHLTWQANQVAKGDYSQRVDFLGSFSDSFNFMISELDKREREIRRHSEEQMLVVERENEKLKSRSERLRCHYLAYRDYIESFRNFREHYKEMMGEVYALFDEGKYDEGRLLIAKINDMMASEVVVSKEYSNDDFINAALTDVGNACRARGVAFKACVYVPTNYSMGQRYSTNLVLDLAELAISFAEMPSQSGRMLQVLGQTKSDWLTIHLHYHADDGLFPEHVEAALPGENLERINRIEMIAAATGSLFHMSYDPEKRNIDIKLHINTDA